MVTLFIIAACLPIVVAIGLAGAKSPLMVLLPLYAVFVPFGKGLGLPGVPPPYNSVSSLLLAGLIASLGAGLVRRRWKAPRATPAIAVWMVFLGIATVTTLWSVKPGQTLSSVIPFAGLIALFVLMRLAPVTAAVVTRVEVAIMTGGLAAASYGIFDLLTTPAELQVSATPRLGEALIEPNHTAAAMILPLSIALSRLVQPDRLAKHRIPARPVYALVIAVLLTAVILTGSRGGILGCVGILVVFLILSRRRARIVAAAVAISAVLASIFAFTPVEVPERLSSSDSSGRSDIWSVGLVACNAYCDTGGGWGTFGLIYAESLPFAPDAQGIRRADYYQPHNNLMLVAVETGVGGLLIVLVGFVLIMREAWRIPIQLRAAPTGAAAGVLFTGLLIGNFEYKYFWLVLMYVGMVSRAAVEADDRPPSAERSLPPVLQTTPSPGRRAEGAQHLVRQVFGEPSG